VVLFYQALQGQKTQYLTRQLVTAPGGALGDFPKFFQGVPKVVKFGFHPSKLKKQPFFSNFENPGGLGPLPMRMLAIRLVLPVWFYLIIKSNSYFVRLQHFVTS